MTTDEVLEALGVPEGQGKTLCPAHEDDKASLSVTLNDEGKILVHCHAGCEQEDLLRALRTTHGITPRDLGNGGEKTRREVARYVYRDGGGNPVFTKIRFEPKEFVIQPAGAAQPLLYNLPQILAATPAKTVVWVEGEKSADRLASLGFLATTLGGAAKAPDKAVKALKGRRVVILPDNDDPGRKHAETVLRLLKANGVVGRILHLCDVPVKGDVVDWLDAGHPVEELQDKIRRAIGVTFAAGVSPKGTAWMWQPRIPAAGLTLIFGEAGIGKSTMVTDLVARWTRGDALPESVGTFRPINVALFGHEDDRDSVVVPRLMAAGADLSRVAFLELDTTKTVLPDQIDYIRQLCAENGVEALVLDNVENSMGGGVDTNNSKSLRAALSPLSFIGIPVLAIHHPKKGAFNNDPREAMSGSQAYTNVARSVMEVMRVSREPDGHTLMALAAVKNNYAPVNQTRTLYFRLESRLVDGAGEQPVVDWVGGDWVSADSWHATIRAERQKQMEVNNSGSPPRPPSPLSSQEILQGVEEVGIIPTFSDLSRGNNSTIVSSDNEELAASPHVIPESCELPPGLLCGGLTVSTSISNMKNWVEAERLKAGMDRATDDDPGSQENS